MNQDEVESSEIALQRAALILRKAGFVNILIAADKPDGLNRRWFGSHEGQNSDKAFGVCLLGKLVHDGFAGKR